MSIGCMPVSYKAEAKDFKIKANILVWYIRKNGIKEIDGYTFEDCTSLIDIVILVHRTKNNPQLCLSIFQIAHGKNLQCTPGTPLVFAMQSEKNVLFITMSYFIYDVLEYVTEIRGLLKAAVIFVVLSDKRIAINMALCMYY